MKKGDLKEQEVLEFIKEYTFKHGIAPSYREISLGVNIKSTNSVKQYIDRLTEKNLIYKHDNKTRSISFKEKKDEISKQTITIPVIGKVAAGEPILAFENVEDEIIISKSVFSTTQQLYMLRISGESMIDIGINDGDFVVVKKQDTAENGEIVVAYIDGYATVKTFYKEGDHFRLQPQNELFRPIITKNCQILGKVVGCIKKF